MSDLRFSQRAARVRRNARTLIQSALAAGGAWALASLIPHHPRPYFAPIAAVIVLSLSIAQQARRAVEVSLGVAVGILVGDVLVSWFGVGPGQIALGVGIAMTAVIFLGGNALVANQAAGSAVLITALPLLDGTAFYARFIDAVVGGAVAIVVAIMIPFKPLALMRRAADPVLSVMIAEMTRTEEAFATGSQELAKNALENLRAVEPLLRDLETAMTAAKATVRLSPARRTSRGPIALLAEVAIHIDRAVRNQRVLLRRGIRLLGDDPQQAARLTPALNALGRALGALLAGLDDPMARADAQDFALVAVRVLESGDAPHNDLSFNVVIAQVRSMAIDVLRATGVTEHDALQRVRATGA